MHSRNPGYVTINNRRAKVQKWRHMPDKIEIAMLVHGYQSGTELLKQMREESIALQWDDNEAVAARPELTHHQLAGEGAATVHRIEATLWLPDTDIAEESIGARLSRVETELKQVKSELTELRRQRGLPSGSQPTSMRQRLDSGQTLIEADIEIEE